MKRFKEHSDEPVEKILIQEMAKRRQRMRFSFSSGMFDDLFFLLLD